MASCLSFHTNPHPSFQQGPSLALNNLVLLSLSIGVSVTVRAFMCVCVNKCTCFPTAFIAIIGSRHVMLLTCSRGKLCVCVQLCVSMCGLPLSHGLFGSLFWITAFPSSVVLDRTLPLQCNTICSGEKGHCDSALPAVVPERVFRTNFHFVLTEEKHCCWRFLWLRCSNCVFHLMVNTFLSSDKLKSWMKFSSLSCDFFFML